MGLDDLFKHKNHGHNIDHGYSGGHRDGGHDDHHHGGSEQYLYFWKKLRSNKKMLMTIAALAIFMIIIVIIGIFMFIPLILKFFGTIQKDGISGLIATVKPMLELLWSGTGK